MSAAIGTHITPDKLVGLPGMPVSTTNNFKSKVRAVEIFLTGENIPSVKLPGRGGPKGYEIKSLPVKTQAYLIKKHHPKTEQQHDEDEKKRQRSEARAQSMELFPRLPAWQQRGAEAKLAIILACKDFIRENKHRLTHGQNVFAHEYAMGRIDVAPDVRDEIRDVHPGTLRAWITAEIERGMMGLVDLYGNRKGQSKIETYVTGTDDQDKPVKPLANTILALICEYPHIKPKRIAEYLPGRCPGAPYVSAKSIERWIEAWKKTHPQEWEYILNPDSWKNKFLTAAGQMDEGVRYMVNARWEIDATPADLLLVGNVRYKIIGLMDVGTRRPILQVTPTEKGLDNAKVVRRGILDWGVPATGIFITDQGNPYKSEIFRRFLDNLNIEHEFCPPFSGDRKPFIERFFRTFSHDLMELLLGYIGHSVADRKAIEARKSFAQRLMGKGNVIEAKITAEELQKFCDRWCADYNTRVHSTLGKSPNQVVSEWPNAIHRIADERALDMLLSTVAGDDGWRTITKKGIKINNYWYGHPAFGDLPGERRVQALETDDIGRVIINRMNEFGVMEFVGIAECPDLTGISRAEVAAVTRARQKRVIAQANELKKQAKRELKGQDIATAIMEHREAKAAEANVTYFPNRTKDYTTTGLIAAGRAAMALDGTTPAPVQAQNPLLTEMRRQLEADMAAPSAKVVNLPVPPPSDFRVPADAKGKYRLWCGLDGQLIGGVEIGERELKFYHGFQRTADWRAFKGMDEDMYSLRK